MDYTSSSSSFSSITDHHQHQYLYQDQQQRHQLNIYDPTVHSHTQSFDSYYSYQNHHPIQYDSYHYYDPSSLYQPPPSRTDPALTATTSHDYTGGVHAHPTGAQADGYHVNSGSTAAVRTHQVYPSHYPPPPQHHTPAIGCKSTSHGGRQGGGPSRGRRGGRGSFGHHPLRQNVGGIPHGRGRGRGRFSGGGGGQGAHIPGGAPAPIAEAMRTQHRPGQDAMKMAATVKPPRPVLPVAWCDICRVDCNSLEILELHKNGKRHKRTVQRMQEIEAQQKMMEEIQAVVPAYPGTIAPTAPVQRVAQVSASLARGQSVHPAPHKMMPVASSNKDSEETQGPSASETTTAAFTFVQASETSQVATALHPRIYVVETQMQMQAADGQPEPSQEMKEAIEVPPSDATGDEPPSIKQQGEGPRMDASGRYDKRYSPKRKMVRCGRGGKKLRFETPRGRPDRVREQAKVCTLCNVTCDTQAVFDVHLGGKRHVSRIKRFKGPGTVFGPLLVYIPPNQPTVYPHRPDAPEPVFYGLKTGEMLEQDAHLRGGIQLEGLVLKQGAQASSAVGEAGVNTSSSNTDQTPKHLEGKTLTVDGQRDVTMCNEQETNAGNKKTENIRAIAETMGADGKTIPKDDKAETIQSTAVTMNTEEKAGESIQSTSAAVDMEEKTIAGNKETENIPSTAASTLHSAHTKAWSC